MGGGRLSRFCLNRIATHARSPSEARPITGGPRGHVMSTDGFANTREADHKEHQEKESWSKSEGKCASRKIMVVVDSSPESKRALLWSLSHTVQDQDTLILLHLVPLSHPGSNSPHHKRNSEESKEQIILRNNEVPNTLMALSKNRRPEVEVEVLVAEEDGKGKGPTIVSQARKHAVSLLILGQRKPSLLWRLLMTWVGGRSAEGVVEYCIQNAECMTVAVRRKNRRAGGYLITTKRQKNFWLLA
ncbi:hypothetical protein SUGI_0952930 [Cryptomeria japonica]|uniref:uncharacterized protein LOC131070545 n=1 Tax=Cryptomeria japonica TaxID=3369 RepID=UPI002414C212|nr:uncharacterized protein LOC131070545 [Cryptomeria japonica]GLJ45276.1 hypothetical protein SUGI_0952930 [Cryptomeria japonica]